MAFFDETPKEIREEKKEKDLMPVALSKIIKKLKKSKGFTMSVLALLLPAIFVVSEFIRCNTSYCDSGWIYSWEDGVFMLGGLVALVLSILAMIVSIVREIKNKQDRLDRIGFCISLIMPIIAMMGFMGALSIGVLGSILIVVFILSVLIMIISFLKKRINR